MKIGEKIVYREDEVEADRREVVFSDWLRMDVLGAILLLIMLPPPPPLHVARSL